MSTAENNYVTSDVSSIMVQILLIATI